jgi:hypothetical protein
MLLGPKTTLCPPNRVLYPAHYGPYIGSKVPLVVVGLSKCCTDSRSLSIETGKDHMKVSMPPYNGEVEATRQLHAAATHPCVADPRAVALRLEKSPQGSKFAPTTVCTGSAHVHYHRKPHCSTIRCHPCPTIGSHNSLPHCGKGLPRGKKGYVSPKKDTYKDIERPPEGAYTQYSSP